MKKFLFGILIVLLGLSCFFVACGKSGDPKEDPDTQDPVKVLEFVSDTATVEMFDELQLAYRQENIIGNVSFSSSAVAVATVDADGKVTGVSAGSTTITVSADGISDTLTLTVSDCDRTKLGIYCLYETLNIYENYEQELNPVILYKERELSGGNISLSVSDDGNATLTGKTVKGVSKGSSVVTITGSINGITLDPVVVNINVMEKVELSLGAENKTIYIFAGSQGQNLPTAFDFDAEVKVNDTVVSDPDIDYTVSDDAVISLSGNTISAVGTGNAVLTATYTTAKDTTVTKTLSITVEKPVAEIELAAADFIKNRATTLDFDFTDAVYGFAGVKEVRFDDAVLSADDYSLTAGVLKIAKDALKNNFADGALITDHGFTVYAENANESFTFTRSVKLTDFVIGNAEELNEFMLYLRANSEIDTKALMASERLYVLLDDDIDWANASFYTRGADVYHGYFTGVIDGQGHTIANLNIDWNAPFWGFATATVKNIAFVNVVKTHNSVGSLLFWNNYGTNVLENVYIKGSVSNAVSEVNLASVCGLGNNLNSSTVKNVVINIEYPVTGIGYATANAGSTSGLENVYVVSSTAAGFHKVAETPADCGLYSSAAAFKAVSAELAQNFDSSMWDVDEGVLMFTSAKPFLPKTTSLAVAIMTATEDGGELYLTAGEHVISTTPSGATLSLANAVEGVSLNGNTLTVGNTVATGTTITINADYIDLVYGNALNANATYKVAVSETIDVAGERILGKNRNATTAVDVSSYGSFTSADVSIAMFNGKDVSASVTINGNNIEISAAGLDTATGVASVSLKKNGSIYIFNINLRVVDHAIGSETEFYAWRQDIGSQEDGTTASTGNNHKIIYAVLTGNITMTETMPNFGNDSDIEGELDGQGYAITDLKSATYSMFNASVGSGFTFKNIAFKNYVSTKASGAASAFFYANGGTVRYENVYIDYTRNANCNRSFLAYNTSWVNCVIELKTTNNTVNVFHDQDPISKGRFTDTLVISSAPIYTDVAAYADNAAVAAAVEAGTVSIDSFAESAFWDTTDGYPVWTNKV